MKLIGGKIRKSPYEARATPVTSVVNDQSIFGFFSFIMLLIVNKTWLQA